MKITALRLLPLVGALALGACTTADLPTLTAPTPTQVQAAAVLACGFVPTVTTVTSILTTNSTVQSAEAIAALICKAVAGGKYVAGMKLGGALPSVNGVVINGSFVR
jgi:hypothetical protein